MTPRILLTLVAAIGVSMLAVTPANAGTKAKPTPAHHHVTIESVDASSITINEPDGVKTYKILPSTEITFQGQDTTVDQLQVGMRVQVIPDGGDDTVAGEIQAGPPPVDPTPVPRQGRTKQIPSSGGGGGGGGDQTGGDTGGGGGSDQN